MVILAGLTLAAGCEEEREGPPPPAPEGTIQAEAIDLGAFCQRLCDRATRCGLESARALSRDGDPTDVAALAKAQTRAASSTASCAENCRGDHPGTKQALRDAERARICLSRPSCEPFIACMRVL